MWISQESRSSFSSLAGYLAEIEVSNQLSQFLSSLILNNLCWFQNLRSNLFTDFNTVHNFQKITEVSDFTGVFAELSSKAGCDTVFLNGYLRSLGQDAIHGTTNTTIYTLNRFSVEQDIQLAKSHENWDVVVEESSTHLQDFFLGEAFDVISPISESSLSLVSEELMVLIHNSGELRVKFAQNKATNSHNSGAQSIHEVLQSSFQDLERLRVWFSDTNAIIQNDVIYGGNITTRAFGETIKKATEDIQALVLILDGLNTTAPNLSLAVFDHILNSVLNLFEGSVKTGLKVGT